MPNYLDKNNCAGSGSLTLKIGLLYRSQNRYVSLAYYITVGGTRYELGNIQPQFPRLRHLWADGGYRTTFVSWVKAQR